MSQTNTGNKGRDLEEVLKAYFWHAGYFVVRGIPFRLEGEDVTDVDLWLYERPTAFTRRRIIVDAKNRRSPKASERLIWTKGLLSALAVDGAIVATTDKRPAAKRLSRALGIILLDGNAIEKLAKADQLQDQAQITSEELNADVHSIDAQRRSDDWRLYLHDARSSLIAGIGVPSTNKNLATSGFFAEQAILAQPHSKQAQTALRLFYLTSAFASISLDYVLADQAFLSKDDRQKSIVDGIRFGEAEGVGALSTIQAAVGLARKYVTNGNATAKQIEHRFYEEANQIPAEIIAQYVARISATDTLFNVAREIERASMSFDLPSYDELSVDAKSLLGVILDFNRISREKVALSWSRGSQAVQRKQQERSTTDGPLFDKQPDPLDKPKPEGV